MNKLLYYTRIVLLRPIGIKRKTNLKRSFYRRGVPTIFFTLSCAEFHWPEFNSIFSDTNSKVHKNSLNNPYILDWLFTVTTEKFVKKWFYQSLGASWHWYRYEFALQRFDTLSWCSKVK